MCLDSYGTWLCEIHSQVALHKNLHLLLTEIAKATAILWPVGRKVDRKPLKADLGVLLELLG